MKEEANVWSARAKQVLEWPRRRSLLQINGRRFVIEQKSSTCLAQQFGFYLRHCRSAPSK